MYFVIDGLLTGDCYCDCDCHIVDVHMVRIFDVHMFRIFDAHMVRIFDLFLIVFLFLSITWIASYHLIPLYQSKKRMIWLYVPFVLLKNYFCRCNNNSQYSDSEKYTMNT